MYDATSSRWVELWSFIWVRKKYWLIPALIMLVVIGGLMVVANESVLLVLQEETWR
jgi:hypothetical protein